MIGRASRRGARVRPVRRDHRRDRRVRPAGALRLGGRLQGRAKVVYGHTPVAGAEWVNNTICIDTGCVFGGKLTALRWPEKELVAVPAARSITSRSGRSQPAPAARPQAEADYLLDIADVLGRRWIETRSRGRIVIAEDNAAAALEVMSRLASSRNG